MNISQRQIGLILLGVMLIGSLLTFIIQLVEGDSTTGIYATITGFIASAALLLAYWRGWAYAGHTLVVVITLIIGLALSRGNPQSTASLVILIPPVLALIYAGPLWVIGSALSVLSIILVRQGLQSPYAEPVTLVLFAMIVAGLILSRIATSNARSLELANARAEDALARAEQQAEELERRAQELGQRNEQQQRLLDLVATLETPAVPIADGVLLAPIVGHIDTRRAQALTTRLLREAAEMRARLVILDISGVAVMDSAVAQALLNTAQALRLLGCDVTLSGISTAIAMTLTHLGIDLQSISTTRSPQEALMSYLETRPLIGAVPTPKRSA